MHKLYLRKIASNYAKILTTIPSDCNEDNLHYSQTKSFTRRVMAVMHFATVQQVIRKPLSCFLYRHSTAQKSQNGWRWTVCNLSPCTPLLHTLHHLPPQFLIFPLWAFFCCLVLKEVHHRTSIIGFSQRGCKGLWMDYNQRIILVMSEDGQILYSIMWWSSTILFLLDSEWSIQSIWIMKCIEDII